MVDHRVAVALLVFSGMLATPADAAICRVTTNGLPGGDGSDWGAQARQLNSALGDAACTEIWVASGVYKPIVPANPSAVTRAEREMSFTVDRPMLLYGGFDGTETALEQRDPSVNQTVLSGDIDGNDILDGNGVTASVADIVGANSFHVLWVDGATANGAIDEATGIDGFIITAGFANDTHPWNSGGRGGGLYCNGEGGGCSPALTNLRFTGNHAHYSGGALYNRGVNGVSSPMLDLVQFVANTAGQIGGAIHNDAQDGISSPQLGDVSFTNNHADASGGAIYNLGMFGTSSPNMFRVTFDDNSAMDEGGAIYNEGLSDGSSETSLVNVILWGNSALNLGAEVFNNNASPRIRDSIVASGCPLDSDCSGGGIIDADPLLGPLHDNGGGTHTMLPGIEGSAIDAGDNANCPSDDQRGLLRPQGEACDIGAVELLVPVSVSVSISGMGVVSAEDFPTPVSGAIFNCSAGGGTNCSADYPGLSEVPLLLEPGGGWAIGSVNGCDGSLAGSVYITSPVSGNCSVVIEFVLIPEIFADRFETP